MKPEIEKLLNHTSVRKYKDKPIEEEKKDIIIRSSQMAPTSSHYQSYSIIEIKSKKTRQILKEISGGQKWVVEAPLVLLYCVDLHRAEKYFEGIDPQALSNLEFYTVAVTDAALAAQKALITAQLLDLGGVFVGGIRNDVERICQELKLPERVAPLFLLCLGYPDQEVGIKPRLPKEEILKTYLQIPEELPARIYELASTITKDSSTTYDKAKAIEKIAAAGCKLSCSEAVKTAKEQ